MTLRAALSGLMLFAGLVFPARALLTGDTAPEPEQLNFLQERRRPVLEFSDSFEKPLKVLVFLNTRSPACRAALPLLTRLAGEFAADGVEFIAITADPEEQSRQLLRDFPDFKLPFAREAKPTNTARYMAGSLIFPKAFVIAPNRRIIWDGEVIDLESMLTAYRAGRFDEARQRRLAPLLSQLQSALRDNLDARAAELAQQIFELDPTNAPALRTRLYMLETANRGEEAWQLLETLRRRAPQAPDFVFPALELVGRHPELTPRLAPLLEDYLRQVPPDSRRDPALAWALLLRQPLSAAALKTAAALLERTSGETAETLTVKALLAARLGRSEEALKLQQQVSELHRRAGSPQQAESQELESYYRELNRLRDL